MPYQFFGWSSKVSRLTVLLSILLLIALFFFKLSPWKYILNWLPIGTHEWEKFVRPNDLINILKKYDLRLDALDGMKFNIIKNNWSLSKDRSINYIGKFIKD